MYSKSEYCLYYNNCRNLILEHHLVFQLLPNTDVLHNKSSAFCIDVIERLHDRVFTRKLTKRQKQHLVLI